MRFDWHGNRHRGIRSRPVEGETIKKTWRSMLVLEPVPSCSQLIYAYAIQHNICIHILAFRVVTLTFAQVCLLCLVSARWTSDFAKCVPHPCFYLYYYMPFWSYHSNTTMYLLSNNTASRKYRNEIYIYWFTPWMKYLYEAKNIYIY